MFSVYPSDNLEQEIYNIKNLEREKFTAAYLHLEDSQFAKLNKIFLIILYLSIFGGVIRLIIAIPFVLFAIFNGVIPVGSFDVVVNIIPYLIITFIARICRALVRLRRSRIENEVYNAARDQREVQEMNDDIKKAIDENPRVSISGNNVSYIGRDNSGTVRISVKGDAETSRTIFELLSFVDHFKNPEAISAAKGIASEAAKNNPNKGEVFSLWNKVVSIIPNILQVQSIVSGISDLISKGNSADGS
jgi:hypothetical protein